MLTSEVMDREREFGAKISRFLSPAKAIQSIELLKGREKHIEDIRRSLFSPGRHIFIHGFRGVGKTSLAHTAAFERQSVDATPILLSCDASSTFNQLICDMVKRAIMDSNPSKKKLEASLAATLGPLSGNINWATTAPEAYEPKTINDAIELTRVVQKIHSKKPIVIIDEFDLLCDDTEHKKFANYIKAVSDQNIQINFIFCGIGDSLDELFQAHESAYRYFHTINLERLPYDPRMEIITTAAAGIGVEVDRDTIIRISMISDGFPHFIHLLCEHLFWVTFEANNGLKATSELYENALVRTVSHIQNHLKLPYEKATRKYTNEYEEILWAVADTHQLQRPSREIRKSYERIMRDRGKEPLDQSKYNTRMNNLKRSSYGEILTASRTGWYSYREPMMRGYSRLRAAQAGIYLEPDHPANSAVFRARGL